MPYIRLKQAIPAVTIHAIDCQPVGFCIVSPASHDFASELPGPWQAACSC